VDPAIIDRDGASGTPLGLFGSGTILLYLAEKTGRLLPSDVAGRYETIRWLFFQIGFIGRRSAKSATSTSPQAVRFPTNARRCAHDLLRHRCRALPAPSAAGA